MLSFLSSYFQPAIGHHESHEFANKVKISDSTHYSIPMLRIPFNQHYSSFPISKGFGEKKVSDKEYSNLSQLDKVLWILVFYKHVPIPSTNSKK